MSWVAIGVSLVGAAASVGGNLLAGNAASTAAQQAEAQRLQGANIAAGQIAQGQAALGEVAAENAPGQQYLRGVVAGSNDLTPEQQKELEDIRLAETNQLRGGPLSGSGRATAAMINDTGNRFVLSALDRNRARADTAAAAMANRGFSAEMGRAQDYNVIGSTYAKAYGDNAGDTMKLGTVKANEDTAIGSSIGTALGNIGSTITKQSKLGQVADSYSVGPTPSMYDSPTYDSAKAYA